MKSLNTPSRPQASLEKPSSSLATRASAYLTHIGSDLIPSTIRRQAARLSHHSFPPKPIFQWIRGELIGKGSYGRVYMGFNANTGEILAVKQVELLPKKQFERTNQQMEMANALKFESETLKDLDHPHIVRYLGYEESPESLNIFLEYVPGGTIESCLSQHGRFSEGLTKSFTTQILEGLEYLHCRGIIHRDLKAANILVDHLGNCKISDFGISKRVDQLEAAYAYTGMKGTVFWMAPEVVSPSGGGYDVKVDIWSVGCIVLEMWSGKRPWAGQEVIAVMLKLHKDKLPPPIPKDLHLSKLAISFRNSCFASNPAKRPMASELQKHPYLTPVPDWSFTQAEVERPPEKHLLSRKQDAVVPEASSRRPISRTLRRPSSSSALGRPRLTTYQHMHFRNTSEAAKPGYGRPPPLVYITPPSSPMKSASGSTLEDDDQIVFNWAATSDSSKSSYQHRKMFYVVNPDPDDSDDERTIRRCKSSKLPYSYNPPPLPSTDVELPSTLETTDPLHPNTHYPQFSPSLSSATTLISASANHSTFSSSDTESDFGGTFWQKPPINLRPLPSLPPPPPTTRPRLHSEKRACARLSRIECKRNSAWHRPHLEDVYQRLDYYFPEHDVDRPVVKADKVASQPKDRRMRKSLRMVAQEQLNRNLSDPEHRVKSALWGSRIEELVIR
ncbi:kinase-like domain-containing protein [Armillaria novae-zelandiae]|uniref:Kinase-like domain-containing protein n=1 Tax=Armillaria novae-zelandiae TaxID=153914 RepID=A0AA39UGS8_9AGAR|nr:kinase-like domain-containing protein [Armillaria novae-zelandiae]